MNFVIRILAPLLLTAVTTLAAGPTAAIPAGKPVLLFLCAGQSNMGGEGFEKDHGLHTPRTDIFQRLAMPPDMIQPDWTPLGQRVALGERRVAQKLGPEASFGIAMAEAFPNHTIALLKVTRGATGISYWTPGPVTPSNTRDGHKVLDALLPSTVDEFDALVRSGHIPSFRVGGVIWMQGEGNANGVQRRDGEYLEGLQSLDTFIREKFRAPADLPFVLGRISAKLSPAVVRDSGTLRVSRSKGGNLPENADFVDDGMPRGPIWHVAQLERVRNEQVAFTSVRPRSAWIDIDDLTLRDGYHYTPEGYIEIGKRFAAAMLPLLR